MFLFLVFGFLVLVFGFFFFFFFFVCVLFSRFFLGVFPFFCVFLLCCLCFFLRGNRRERRLSICVCALFRGEETTIFAVRVV